MLRYVSYERTCGDRLFTIAQSLILCGLEGFFEEYVHETGMQKKGDCK